jgi:hypothetical protein
VRDAEMVAPPRPVEDWNDVRVRQVRRGLSLAPESLDKQRILAELGIENLQCNGATKKRVLGPIDHRHAASRNEVGDLIAA